MSKYENQLLKTYNKISDEFRPMLVISESHAEELAEYYDFPMEQVEDMFEVAHNE